VRSFCLPPIPATFPFFVHDGNVESLNLDCPENGNRVPRCMILTQQTSVSKRRAEFLHSKEAFSLKA
jgi:hypothetical protein